MDKSTTIGEFAKALRAAQADMPKVERSAQGQVGTRSYQYAPLDVVLPAALKLLNENGLSVCQMVSHNEHGGTLTTMLMHDSGEYIAADQPLHLVQDTPQAQGSAITYARRYAIMAAIGMVAEEDDDGHAATKAKAKAAPRASGGAIKAAPAQGAAVASNSGRPMKAAYPGECYICGNRIAKGEDMIFLGGKKIRHPFACAGEEPPVAAVAAETIPLPEEPA